MKIKGQKKDFFRTKEVIIPDSNNEPFIFTLYTLPIDVYDELRKEFPKLTPPKTFAKDKNGKLEKGQDGKPVVIYDDDDEKYQEQKKEIDSLQSVALLVKALSKDPNVEFEAKRESYPDNLSYYRALHAEIKQSLPLGVFLKLVEETSQMMQIKSDEVEEAKESFLSKTSTP